MPDEAIYAARALGLWQHGTLPICTARAPATASSTRRRRPARSSVGKAATGLRALKLVQALVMSLVAVPVFFYGRRLMPPGYALRRRRARASPRRCSSIRAS